MSENEKEQEVPEIPVDRIDEIIATLIKVNGKNKIRAIAVVAVTEDFRSYKTWAIQEHNAAHLLGLVTVLAYNLTASLDDFHKEQADEVKQICEKDRNINDNPSPTEAICL